MKELIERLEKATGPDRELDVEIVFALYPEIGAYQPHCVGEEPRFWNDPYYKQKCPKFTESIDAALTLVPAHYCWQIKHGIGCEAIVWSITVDYDDEGAPAGYSTTFPAIALCIAAMRARDAG